MRKLVLLTAVVTAIFSLTAGSALAAPPPPNPVTVAITDAVTAAFVHVYTPSGNIQAEQETLGGTSITFSGTVSSTNPGGVSWTWTKGSGAGETTIGTGTGGAASVTVTIPLGFGTKITLYGTDSLGKINSAARNSIVVDHTVPNITAPADIVQEQTSLAGTEVVALGDPTVSDICDAALTVTNNAPAVFPLGTTVVIWTATDDTGNYASANQSVTVKDETAPSITAPADVTQEQTSLAGTEVVALGTATATDICDGDVTVTNDAPGTFPLGETDVTYTATDAAGNIATAVQQVTVTDTTEPAIALSIPGPIAQEQTTLAGTEVVDLGTASATDICDGDVTVTSDAPGTFPLGETDVTYTATDAAGNTATVVQQVTVTDETAPSITAPADIVQEQTTLAGTEVVALGTATASDICDASPVITNDAPGTFPLGTTVVTWTATDADGNSASAAQNVTVNDTTAPGLTVTNNIAGGNATMSTPPVYVKAVTVSSVSDICDATPVVTMVWSNAGSSGWPAGTSVKVGATVVPANTRVVVPVGSSVYVYTVSHTSNYRYILNFTATDETGNVTATQKVINLNKPSGGGGGGSATGSFKAGAS